MAVPFLLQRRPIGVAWWLFILLAGTGTAYSASPGLHDLDLEDLLKVRVVGASKYEQAQADVPAAVAVITHEEIHRFGWRTLGEALQTLPGVYSSYNRQYAQVGTRGFGMPGDFNTRLLITINGNRLNDPVYDGSPSGRDFPLDMDLIERIEFIPGPGSTVYGQNAMFGVVNVITRKGSDLIGTEANLQLQQPQNLREGRLSFGGVLDNGLEALFSVSALRSQGDDLFLSYGASGVQGIARNLDGERNTQAFAQLSQGAWQFEWTHGTRRKDDPTGVYLSDPLSPGQYQRDTYSVGQLRYQTAAGETWDLSARLFAGAERYEAVTRYGANFRNTGRGDWWGTEWQLVTTLGLTHHVLVGVEYQDNRNTDLAAQDAAHPQNNLSIDAASHRLGVYAQDEWRIRPTLTATLGLRADSNANGRSSLSPRTALIWKANSNTTMKALFGEANRQANTNESLYADGVAFIANPQLRGEKIQTAELVAEHRPNEDLFLRASLFRWSLDDVIVLGQDRASGLAQYQSGPLIHAEGAELSADRSWPAGIRLRGSVSFSNESTSGQAPAVNSPRWLSRALLSAPLPVAGLQLAYEMRYDDRRSTYARTSTGGQLVSDLRLSTDSWLPRTELALKIRNLFDRRYAHPTARTNWQSSLEQDSRSIILQLQARF